MSQSAKIDMSLDEIIKIDNIRLPRNNGGGGRNNRNNFSFNRQRYDGPRGGDRYNSNSNRRFSPGMRNLNTHHQPKRLQRESPLLSGLASRLGSNDRNSLSGRRHFTLHISNLAASVSSEDLEELFCSFGTVVRSFVHFDQFGSSLGTAEVTFEQREEAIDAMHKLDNVPLDGKSMKITLIGADADEDPYSLSLRQASSFMRGGNNNRMNGEQRRFGFRRNDNHNKRNENLTADDLDKEMDEWRNEQQHASGDAKDSPALEEILDSIEEEMDA